MAPRILLTNDDGWDAPGLAALRDAAASLGEVVIVAPRDPHSYAGHRVTTDAPMELRETGPGAYSLAGTPADCVRVALRSLFPEVELVVAGINRGGNLGADIYSSGTVAAAREAALLGRRGLAISQFLRRGAPFSWNESARLAGRVLVELIPEIGEEEYWNVNLPHLEEGQSPAIIRCEPDFRPLDVRFDRDGNIFRYSGTYVGRPRSEDRDIAACFGGAVSVSRFSR